MYTYQGQPTTENTLYTNITNKQPKPT